MSYSWITDVLTDLRDFARANDMTELARHLEGTLDLARAEIARVEHGSAEVSEGEGD